LNIIVIYAVVYLPIWWPHEIGQTYVNRHICRRLFTYLVAARNRPDLRNVLFRMQKYRYYVE